MSIMCHKPGVRTTEAQSEKFVKGKKIHGEKTSKKVVIPASSLP